MEFEEKFVEKGNIQNLDGLSNVSLEQVENIWANERSWNVATSAASHLHELLVKVGGLNDSQALRTWARNASLENWIDNPIGQIDGVGLITYQYHRMMGGVDTAMPVKVVKRIVEEVLEKAGERMH